MPEERNFYEEAGFEMPVGVESVTAEGGFEYYKFPAGLYRAVFGKMRPLYRNADKKSCEPTDIGAKLYSFQNYLWVTQYLGTSTHPEKKDILIVKDSGIVIPEVQQMAELYYSNFISYLPEEQWREHKKFESFVIPGHEQHRIISPDPANPSKKKTNFKNFPFYYGMTVEFNLVLSAKGNPYMDSFKLITDAQRVPVDMMKALEVEVDARIQREIEARKAKKDEGYKPQSVETTDFTQFTGGDSASTSDGLDDFLNG